MSSTNVVPLEPGTTYRAIHRQVLLVCRHRIEGTWKCYVTPVPGQNHDLEMGRWQEHGSEMTERDARHHFPEMADTPYAT